MSMIEEMIAYQIGYAFIEVGLCSTPESAFGYLPRDGEDRKYLVQVIARFMFPEYPDDVEFDRMRRQSHRGTVLQTRRGNLRQLQ